jgi:starch synthase
MSAVADPLDRAGAGAVDPSRARAVELVSHLQYYRHAAEALESAGWLHRYLTMPFRTRALPGTTARGFGRVARHVNETRVFPDLAGVPSRRLWGGQVADRVVRALLEERSALELPLRSLAWDLDASLHLRADLRDAAAPRVLHLSSGIARHSAELGRRAGAKVIIDVRTPHHRGRLADVAPAVARHGLEYRLPNESNLRRLEAEYALADLLVCNSDYSRTSFLDAGFDEDRVVALPLGCSTDLFRPATAPPEGFTALFVGRNRYEKGLLDVLEAAHALRASTRLRISGPPDAISLERSATVAATVEFLGPITMQRMPEVYRQASVFVFPSLSDGFGLVVPEAMASGLPVIVSDHTGAADLVTEGVDGFVVPAGDADALADRLQLLESDPDLVARMGAQARATAEANAWTRYQRRLLAIYESHVWT